MNKKILILALISLSVVLASRCEGEEANNPDCLCHPSCICNAGSSICRQCRFEELGSVKDENKKSCPCPAGYFTSSLYPFSCTKLLVPDQEEDIDTVESSCYREINMRIRDISLNTNCYFCLIDGKSYVISEVSLNFNSVSLTAECKVFLDQKIKYLHPVSNSYVELNRQYLEQQASGGWTVRIPLIDLFNLSLTTNVGSAQISQQINFLSLLGTKGRYVKQIKWAICVYTNRDAVQVFQLDIDIQQTEQDCIDCIVIADLETVGEVYSDDTYTNKLTSPYQYIIGDYFHAKITFKDASYTKYLRFVALYYKNDIGMIYDLSSITDHSWYQNGLIIRLPLHEPSHPAMIQILMKIDDVLGGRFLQESNNQNQKNNFSFDVASKKEDEIVDNNNNNTEKDDNKNDKAEEAANNDYNEQASASLMLLGLINFMVYIFLF